MNDMRYGYSASIVTLHLLLAASAASAQQAPPTQRLSGIVLSSTGSSFVIVDKDGNEIPVAIKSDTSFTNNRAQVPITEVIKPGMEVRVYLASAGVASEVQARGQVSGLNLNQLRAFMRSTREEWAIIAPKIERVLALRRQAEGRSTNSNNGNNGNNANNAAANPNLPTQENPVRVLLKSLQASLWSATPNDQEMQANLDKLRAMRAKSRAELAQARRELTELLTRKQEMLLVVEGILE
jgi:hypothetical protein